MFPTAVEQCCSGVAAMRDEPVFRPLAVPIKPGGWGRGGQGRQLWRCYSRMRRVQPRDPICGICHLVHLLHPPVGQHFSQSAPTVIRTIARSVAWPGVAVVQQTRIGFSCGKVLCSPHNPHAMRSNSPTRCIVTASRCRRTHWDSALSSMSDGAMAAQVGLLGHVE